MSTLSFPRHDAVPVRRWWSALGRLAGSRLRLALLGVLLVCCAASVLTATQASPTHHPASSSAAGAARTPAAAHVVSQAVGSPAPRPASTPTAPRAAAVPAPSPVTGVITIRWGDTLWALARHYGTTVPALQQLNHLGHTSLIRAGATLLLPTNTVGSPPAVSSRVVASRAVHHGVATGHATLTATSARHSTVGNTTMSSATGVAPAGSVRQAAAAVFGSQYTCAATIITRESGWNVHATNPTSGAYGLAQALPGSKMATAGPGWRDDPATQLAWMRSYVTARYGGACGAWAFWQTHSWY